MGTGARGLVMGRSIWQTEDPAAVIAALDGIVHEGADATDVWSA